MTEAPLARARPRSVTVSVTKRLLAVAAVAILGACDAPTAGVRFDILDDSAGHLAPASW